MLLCYGAQRRNFSFCTFTTLLMFIHSKAFKIKKNEQSGSLRKVLTFLWGAALGGGLQDAECDLRGQIMNKGTVSLLLHVADQSDVHLSEYLQRSFILSYYQTLLEFLDWTQTCTNLIRLHSVNSWFYYLLIEMIITWTRGDIRSLHNYHLVRWQLITKVSTGSLQLAVFALLARFAEMFDLCRQ